MSILIKPAGYKSALSVYETQVAIGTTKRTFEDALSLNLNLKRVSAPLFVEAKTGLNDDLNGVERAVGFDILETKTEAQVVHSLAKWKRMALHKYGFKVGEGLYTDMNAIRRDEEMSNIHSIYVDQWDWEKIIKEEDRTLDFLKATMQKIVNAIVATKDRVNSLFPALKYSLTSDITFVTTQELEDMYPSLTPKEREDAIAKAHKTVCILQIGDILKSGAKHDGRAPDYDDWAINGDIIFWNDVLQRAFEVSSMGVRVSPKSLDEQLNKAGANERRELDFHKMLLNGELPYTIGGGIGQSRLSMLLLEKAHIGEIQASIWDNETLTEAKKVGIELL